MNSVHPSSLASDSGGGAVRRPRRRDRFQPGCIVDLGPATGAAAAENASISLLDSLGWFRLAEAFEPLSCLRLTGAAMSAAWLRTSPAGSPPIGRGTWGRQKMRKDSAGPALNKSPVGDETGPFPRGLPNWRGSSAPAAFGGVS